MAQHARRILRAQCLAIARRERREAARIVEPRVVELVLEERLLVERGDARMGVEDLLEQRRPGTRETDQEIGLSGSMPYPALVRSYRSTP